MENGEENEESIDDEGNNVGKCCKGEGHSAPGTKISGIKKQMNKLKT